MHKPTERVLRILLTLASEKEDLTLTEISEKTKIPKSTISPILSTLVDMRFLAKKSEMKYRIGINSFIVGEAYIESTSFLEMIKSYMTEVVKECNEICQLGILQDNKVFYIAKKDPKQSIQLMSYVGKFLPIYSTALGKVLVYKNSEEEIKDIVGDNMVPLTERTITDIDDFLNEIETVKNNGYSFDLQETSLDSKCVAVPIEKGGKVIAAMSVSIPNFRSTDEKLKNAIQVLLKYKKEIESYFTHNIYNEEDLI
ncbi:IclR family transcriptional regulator [Peptoniphilus sp. AGMB00490]|uniref:IclR family transcriptional regulator n=2 Tax=Peptoniphilus TaxID=162289 RepID=A0ACD6AZ69_9FIRM|nr:MULTISPECIES: IclR family transcriptional regulator [Peptoniphilus]NMW85592.1 IclR family transcriptional regulator [Peptoniphilus faecalis]OLR64598.1 hypothetical protein BIV18_03140 [Peptoniphilus porci]